MKNGLLIWNIVLTLIAGYLIYAHFTSSKKTTDPVKAVAKDTTANSSFRIAYFEMDSIASALYIVKDFRKEMSKREEYNDSQLEGMRRELQRKFTEFQAQVQSGKMTVEVANEEMQKENDKIRDRKQELDNEYSKIYSVNENEIKKQIEGFLKEYNKNRTYSYIFANQPGLFYFCDTVYDITGDVVKGINEKYKAKPE